MPDEREDQAFLVQQRINEYLGGDGFGSRKCGSANRLNMLFSLLDFNFKKE